MIPNLTLYAGDEKDEALNFLTENFEQDQKLVDLENMDESPDFYDGRMTFYVHSRNAPFSISASLVFTGSEQDRETVRELVNLVGLDREYQADDRGRVTLGSQYSGSKVKVAVIEEIEEESGED